MWRGRRILGLAHGLRHAFLAARFQCGGADAQGLSQGSAQGSVPYPALWYMGGYGDGVCSARSAVSDCLFGKEERAIDVIWSYWPLWWFWGSVKTPHRARASHV